VEIAHNAALDERPKAFNRVRMNRANDTLAFAVVNSFVWETMLQSVISGKGVGAKQTDFGRDRLSSPG
jgi:hypothetical protein